MKNLTPTIFIRPCIEESERYMASFDPALLRPRFIPAIAKLALAVIETAARIRTALPSSTSRARVQIGTARSRASEMSSRCGHAHSCGSYTRNDSTNERQKSSLCSFDPICTMSLIFAAGNPESRAAKCTKKHGCDPRFLSFGQSSRFSRAVPSSNRLSQRLCRGNDHSRASRTSIRG